MKIWNLVCNLKCWIFVLFLFPFSPLSSQSYNAILLNQQTSISVKNQKLFIDRSFDIQINNRIGNNATEVSIPFSKLVKIDNIEACIQDTLGNIIKKLRTADVTERSSFHSFSFYEDSFVKEFTLVHNVFPYILHYSYQEEQKSFLHVENWLPVINHEIPTLNATLTILVPLQYKIKSFAKNIDSCKIDTLNSNIQYSWKASYKHPIENEIYSPSINTFCPSVIVVPEKFKYDIEGSFVDWKSYGNWQSRLIDGITDLPFLEQSKIDKLTSNIVNVKDKVKVLYHYLQDETRYVNVSINTGGMKPYSATYVADNKYGDCKALSNYFRSMLKHIGINSYYVNVLAGDEIRKVEMNFPSQQFNHIIVCVPQVNDTLWLDCTSKGPFNSLGTFTQHREVFLVDKTNSFFVKTPVLTLNDVLETRYIKVKPSTENEIIANFHNVFKGENFESLFYLFKNGSETNKDQSIRLNYIETGFDLIDYKVVNAPRDSGFITLNYNAKNGKLYKKYGAEQLYKVTALDIPPFRKPELRKLPVQINFPVFKIDTVEFQIPFGYKLLAKNQNQHIVTRFGEYDLQFIPQQDKMLVIKRFILKSGNYPIEEYGKFYEFIGQIAGFENNTYIISTKINTL
jgi:hypothetical protein